MRATIGPDGRVINQGSHALIQPFYGEALNILLEKVAVVATICGQPQSVYVRGSVAVGEGIKGLSDIDLVVIYEGEINQQMKVAYQQVAKAVTDLYPGSLDEVDITVTTLPSLLYDAEIKNLKIYLKYQSVLLSGKDILDHLPEVYPGRNLALFMYGDIEQEFTSLEAQFKGVGRPKVYQKYERPTRFWCVWLARTVLRSGMALSMAKEKVLTQNLLECRDITTSHFPHLTEMMSEAVRFAIDPTDDAKECVDFIDKYSDTYIKLWQDQKGAYEESYN